MWKWKVKVAQSCPTLCNPMDYTVHGIFQARILEWVAIFFSRGSSRPRDQIHVSCIDKWVLYYWATRTHINIVYTYKEIHLHFYMEEFFLLSVLEAVTDFMVLPSPVFGIS